MKKAYFYIGSNNDTNELETDKIENIFSNYFDGFTAYEVIGYWQRAKEKTLKVEVVTDESNATLARVAKELKRELKQDAILLEIINSNVAFI